MARAMTNFDRAGSVRRVLRRGDQHVCGLCRNEYHDVTVAQACVVRCWTEFLAMSSVIKRTKGKSIQYRCRFCARDYLVEAEAESCGHACRDKLMADFEVEAMLTEEVGAIPNSPPKRVRPKLRMVYLQPPRVIKKKAPETEANSAHDHAPEEAPAAAAAPDGAAQVAAEDHHKEADAVVAVKKVEHA